ncbi:alpha/beta hydrolase [Sulfurimonas sp. MAG313]|nr:alpha/beta fold hydrolase [Sulfurimonas sp. MAG313]MDF1881658.1 alpha/beta hydrolase [Sulfurimonas sp. MAG313]
MSNLLYSSSHYLIKMVESILDTNIHVHGEENLHQESPTLFVANHFTRFETFVMPYVIYSHSNMEVRSLADHSIFVGYFGKFLNKVGTLSTNHESRNEIILGDLITGRKNWIIYPEGAMVKNKKIVKNGGFILDFLDGKAKVHTGAAVMAMEAELIKQDYKKAQQAGDILKVRSMREKYFMQANERVSYKNTVVVPINITYTPIRAGVNPLMNLGDKFVDKIDDRIKEELEIEGNILLNAEIHVRFDKAIDMSEYLYRSRKEMKCQDEECSTVSDAQLIDYNRHNLTTQFMDAIYKNTLINFDHIFSLVLEFYKEKFIGLNELKRAIFLAARDVVGLKILHVHHSIKDELYKLLTDEKDPWFESVLSLSVKQGILIHVEDELYKIDEKAYANEHDFHTIRIKNTLRVIFNEISLFESVGQSVKHNLCKSSHEIKEEVFHVVFNKDRKIFKQDYNTFYSVISSKPKDIGTPFVLYKPEYSVGIVLSHGYKSSPSEIKELAEYLHTKGMNVYGVRLKGHGTLSEDLRDSTWEQWYDSFNRGFAAMRQVNKKLFVIGFSTGGLLAILATARKLNKVDGLVVINAALELQDIRVNYVVPTLNKLNDFLSLFKADLEYVESEPEFPDFNYKRNYIKSLDQLRLLMQECSESLALVTSPTLILQGKDDPVVKPQSAQKIFDSISSEDKQLEMFDSSRHVIVLGEGNKRIFKAVSNFITSRL